MFRRDDGNGFCAESFEYRYDERIECTEWLEFWNHVLLPGKGREFRGYCYLWNGPFVYHCRDAHHDDQCRVKRYRLGRSSQWIRQREQRPEYDGHLLLRHDVTHELFGCNYGECVSFYGERFVIDERNCHVDRTQCWHYVLLPD